MTADEEPQATQPNHTAATTAQAAITNAQNTAQDAKASAAAVASTMKDKATALAGQVADQADAATTATGEKLSDAAQALRTNAPTTGMVATIATAAADTLDNAGTYVQQHDLGDMRADLVAHIPASSTITRQIADRPWTAVGIALATGYLLGSLGGGDESDTHAPSHAPAPSRRPARRPARGWAITAMLKTRSAELFAPFDDEIDMVKDAAIATVRDMLHEAVRTNIPAMSQHLDAAK